MQRRLKRRNAGLPCCEVPGYYREDASSPLLPKYKTNFSQCLVHFFDELRHHLVKTRHVLFIPLNHDIMQAFTLHARVIVGKVPGIFSRHLHAVLHLGHVSRFYCLETTEPEFHEIPGGTSIAGSVACIRMQSLIRGNRTRITGWLPTCTRTCGPMRWLTRNYGARLPMN